MNWWRVTIDSSGKITDCHKFEYCEAEANGIRVYYVEAESGTQAIAIAHRRYLESREKAKRALSARREAYKSKGLCRCGSKPRDGLEQCQKCADASKNSMLRARAKTRHEPVPELPPKSVALAKTATQRILDVLLEVRVEWQRSPNVRVFSKWLDATIEGLQQDIRGGK